MQKHVVKILASLLLVTVVLSGIAVFMASTASNPSLDGVSTTGIYMDLSIDGVKVEGDSTTDQYVEWIILMAYQYSAADTADQSGRVSGKIQLSPITIVKQVDKSSPQLMEALITNKNIDATIKTVGANPVSGMSEVTLMLTIDQGRIVSMTQTVQTGDSGNGVSIDTIKIVYERLTIDVFEGGNVVSTVTIDTTQSGA